MRRIVWLRQAARYLNILAGYIADDKPEAARRFIKEVRLKIKRLGQFPSLGWAGRFPGTRELIIHKRYIFVYRVRGEQVEILRVHHVARDWPMEL